MQNAVFESGFDAVTIDVFGKRKHSFVVAIGVFGINPLIAGMSVGTAASTDCQHAPLERDFHPIGCHAGHLSKHDDIVTSFIDVRRRHEYWSRRRLLTPFGRLRRPLLDRSDFLGHDSQFAVFELRSADVNLLWPVRFKPF